MTGSSSTAPPGLTETSEQVLRAADLIIVPVIPSPLSQRALDEVDRLPRPPRRSGTAPILPVYNMVDRRRSLHLAALAAHPDWPVDPDGERVRGDERATGADRRRRPRSPAAGAARALWPAIEKRLASRQSAVDAERAGPTPADEDARSRTCCCALIRSACSRCRTAATPSDLYWVEPRRRAIIPLDRLPSLQVAAQDAAIGPVRGHPRQRLRRRSSGSAPTREETWINAEIEASYIRLHEAGHAHSIEVWQDGELVGGLYGVRLGAAFFGESMFSLAPRRLEGRAGLAGRAADRRRLHACSTASS